MPHAMRRPVRRDLHLTCALALLLAAGRLPAEQGAGPIADLTGLWGAEESFGPEVRGLLSLERDGDAWRVSIAGVTVEPRVEERDLSFEIPGDRGAFRGSLQADRTFLGHWIQPASVVDGVRFASPVVLRRTGVASWRGEVVPHEDRLTLYLLLERRSDGSVGAYLRNPERNVGMFYRFGPVTRNGDEILFFDRDGSEVLLRGTYRKLEDREPGVLSIFFPSYGATFDFTRRGRDEAPGFYPRSAGESTYVYRPPTSEKDGWVTASLESVDVDPEPIRRLVQSVLDTETGSVTAPYLQGLLMARRGQLVLEEYFYGFHGSRPHDTRSAGKSVTSALAGIALDQGAGFDVSTPVYPLLEDAADLENLDPRKRALTVEHLLTMSSGFACDDMDPESPGNEDRMQSQREQPDWIRYTLDLPMARDPGERGVYCTAGIHLLGGIVAETTGAWLPDFFQRHFARPLQIWRYHFNLTPTGDGFAGGGVRLLPRDFLKLGQVYLNGGRWLGRPVVSEEWVSRSTRPHAGLDEEDDYGYGWWLKTYRHQDRDLRAFYASGNGGQLVIVLPELDLVVLFAGGNYGNYPTWRKFRDELVPEFILPAIRESDASRRERAPG